MTSSVQIAGNDAQGYNDDQLALSLRLIQISATGNLLAAKELTDQGADAWVQDSEGSTALHAACSKFPHFPSKSPSFPRLTFFNLPLRRFG